MSLREFRRPVQAVLLASIAISAYAIAPASAKIETIIVTAEKRSQNLQTVPASVSVISNLQMKRSDINSISELQQLAPSITFSDGPNARGQGINIRGIGTQNFSDGVEPSVSTVVDGVVLGRQAMSVFDLMGIKRIEVLRGPQGTLFGKNASAGVVNIITKQPSNRNSLDAQLSYASLNEVKAQASANVALAHNLDALITGYSVTRDGTGTNIHTGQSFNNDNEWGLRGRLLYRPSRMVKFLLTVDYARINNNCCVATPLIASPLYAAIIAPLKAGPQQRNANYNTPTFEKQTSWGVALETDVNLGFASLTSITAYRGFHDHDNNDDGDLSPLPLLAVNSGLQNQHQFTQELRIASPDGTKLRYTLGAFLFQQRVASFTQQSGSFGTPYNLGSNVNRSISTTNYAFFGQASYDLITHLRVIGGFRWTHDSMDAEFARINTPGTVAGFPGQPPLAQTPIKASDNNLSYKTGLKYNVVKNVMLYATVASGFKGAAINLLNNLTAGEIASGTAVLKPETSTDYEVGMRSQFWDRRATINLTGFWTHYSNFQSQSYDPATASFVLANAGALRTRGVEADLALHPISGLTLSSNASYTEATFLNYISSCYPGQTAALGCAGAPARQNLAGAVLANAPKMTFNLSANYDFEIPRINKLGFVYASYYHTSKIQFSNNQDPHTIQPAYGILNFSVGVETENGHYSLSLFAKNLLDQHFASIIFANSFLAGSYSQIMPADAQRIIGVRVAAHF